MEVGRGAEPNIAQVAQVELAIEKVIVNITNGMFD